MAKLTIGQKAQRVLKLLLGLRNARIAEALGAYGFTKTDLDDGWKLLKALTGGRLSQLPSGRRDPTLLDKLDEWENRWFPVASASLAHRYPDVHAWLFLNLAQTEGAEVIVSVGTLLDRLNAMASEPSLGSAGAEARNLLAQRGLNAATLEVAQNLLAQAGSTAPATTPTPMDAEAAAKAEQAMWNWYLEWGEIARVAVKDRRLLRELGFLNLKRSLAEEIEEDVADDVQPEAPAAG
jgi:hypothetical protein